MEPTKQIYIMISQTHTKIARLIRRFGKTKYNHAAVALDAGLERLYAFARPHHKGIFLARLVQETVFRYTLGKTDFVGVMIFRLEVTKEQYRWVSETIDKIQNDGEFVYNLLSVLTYPVFKGFGTYKAFSCIEFIMYILGGVGYKADKPLYRYRPDDLRGLLADSLCFEGNLLDYKTGPAAAGDNSYYSPMSLRLIKDSSVAFKRICARSLFRRTTGY